MKFTILGFSQKKLVEMKLDLDEALILRYFVDFKDSGSMVKEYMEDDMYYWINYDSMKKELPILDISKDRIYRKLKNLVVAEVLKHKTKKAGGTFSFYAVGNKYKDLIMDSLETTEGTVKITEGYGKNNGTGTVKITEGYGKNNGTKDSSIKDSSIKNSSINIYVEIIDYLNKIAGTKYKHSNKKTRDLINARLNDGFTIDDFKAVINKKHSEWTGTDFEKFIRPETLFSNKFEGYLNQKHAKANTQKSKGNFNNFSQRELDPNIERQLLDKSLDDINEVDTKKMIDEIRKGKTSNG